MKRFTRKDEFGNYIIGELNDLGFDLEFEELNKVTKAVNKLGKLEDLEEKLGIGIVEFVNLHGKQIYIAHEIVSDRIIEATVENIVFYKEDGLSEYFAWVTYKNLNWEDDDELLEELENYLGNNFYTNPVNGEVTERCDTQDFNKTWFLTREEAEKKLRELKNDTD